MQERLFYISGLIEKQLNGTIGAEEVADLNKWVSSSAANKKLYEQLHDEEFVKEQLKKFNRYNAEKNKEYLKGELEALQKQVNDQRSMVNSERVKVRKLWKRIAVAASIIGVLFVAGYFIRQKDGRTGRPEEVAKVSNDVQAPDKNRAQITLADGTVVYLDSVSNSELANENGVKVMKTADGKIEYIRDPSTLRQAQGFRAELIYNTLSNPRGSKVIDMMLADGSHVWLNAGSSITYPVAFYGNERNVKITGEAYFEVEKDAGMLFVVSANDMEVKVLGTHFNINSYADEADIKTTLLEGSVKVSIGINSSLLKPGQQAVAVSFDPKNGNAKSISIKNDVNLEQVMAWKNGLFNFNKVSLQEVMKQIARWYDVDVVYQGEIKPKKFGGEIQRDLNLSEVLEGLKETGIHFRIEGKKLIILP